LAAIGNPPPRPTLSVVDRACVRIVMVRIVVRSRLPQDRSDDATGLFREPRTAILKSVMTKIGIRLVLLLAIVATIGCDRVTKHVAATRLSEGVVS